MNTAKRSRLLLGIDLGTSGVKSIIADETGQIVASSLRGYPLLTPHPGWAEQNPADWWNAVVAGLAEILPKVHTEDLAGVSFSGQMHGLVALDKDWNVIRPAFLWCDQRTDEQCRRITELAGGLDGLLSYTNNRMLTGYTGGKLLWLREKEPENFERMQMFVCPKDYIRFRLTGIAATDVSEASGIGFFNTRKRVWSDELIALAQLPKSIFPEVHESTEQAGVVTEEAAEVTGLPKGLKVYYGGGDAVIQTTGSGLLRPGIVSVVIGTAGNVSMALDHFYDNPNGELQMFCNNEPGLWHAFGCPLTAGGAYRWYRDVLFANSPGSEPTTELYEIMNSEAEQSVPGARGVIFAPYLTGERCPYPDPNARGCFYGLTLGTTRADITRSVMEGVTYALMQIIDIMRSFSPCSKVIASGGGSVSRLWRQMQADVFDMPVYTVSGSSEGGAYGAMMVAGVGAGVWKNLEEASGIVKVQSETLPVPENQKGYRESYEIYKEIYPSLKKVYDLSASKGY